LATLEFRNKAVPPNVHCADQRISLDLNDGVKVIYGKCGDLLAEVTAVTGKKKE
jgi:hypothetical protein